MIKIAAISDLHGFLPEVPPCDILLIAGDLCRSSKVWDQLDFLRHDFGDWLDEIPAKEVVGIAGNHDFIFEKKPDSVPRMRWHYLQDSAVELFGLKIWGSPWQPRFYDWAFNLDEPELAAKFAMIPEGIDILVTHGPPLGYGDTCERDNRVGSPSLFASVMRVQPKLHVFGHIHEGRGEYRIGGTIASNVSHVDLNYNPIHKPMTFDLIGGEE